MKHASLCMAILLLAAGSVVADEKKDEGWVSLFDGKTLKGWTDPFGEGTFEIKDGAIRASDEGTDSEALLYNGKVEGAQFKNFEFKADVKIARESNSGIFFRALQHR